MEKKIVKDEETDEEFEKICDQIVDEMVANLNKKILEKGEKHES